MQTTKRARLLDLDRVLHDAIARAEPKRTPHPHAGKRKHAALVEGPEYVRVAIARYLIWHSYLNRMPTKASVTKAFHIIRGQMLWRMGRLAHEQGREAQRRIPPFALAKPAIIHRADTPDDGGGDSTDYSNTDPASWWDDNADAVYGTEFAQDTGLYDESFQQLTPEEKAAIIAETGSALVISDWLNGALDDSAVMQVLDAAWNGASITQAGQDFFDTAGVAGMFDLTDTNMMQYLQQYAGQLVTKVDATTRQQLAQALWEGLGGGGGSPLAMDALARYLQNEMNQLGNALAGMSRQRARMIAITETARAESVGNLIAMLQTGVKLKQWSITTGACLICEGNQSMGGIPILDQFPSGDLSPPAHPVCRCSITAWFPPDAAQQPFNPADWSGTIDSSQIDALFNDPSFAYFPMLPLDLNRADTLRQQLSAAVLGDTIDKIIQFTSSQLSNHATIEEMLDVLTQHPARVATAEHAILAQLRHVLRAARHTTRSQVGDTPLYAACVAALQALAVPDDEARRLVLASWDLLSNEWNDSTTI